MVCKWQTLCSKTLIWLVVEILLTLTGMDDLADYSEFVFKLDRSYSSQTSAFVRSDDISDAN